MNPSPPLNEELIKRFPYNWAFSTGTLLPLFPNQLPSQFYSSPQMTNSQINPYPDSRNRVQLLQQLKPKIEKQHPIVKFQYVISEEEIQPKQKHKSIEQPKQTLEPAIYIHPLPLVTHKAKYFDPSAASNLTSPSYNLVFGSNPKENSYSRSSNPSEHREQLEFPEQEKNPYIFFRHRRIKKKYRKYFQGKFCPESQNSINHSSQSEIDEQSAGLLDGLKRESKKGESEEYSEQEKESKEQKSDRRRS